MAGAVGLALVGGLVAPAANAAQSSASPAALVKNSGQLYASTKAVKIKGSKQTVRSGEVFEKFGNAGSGYIRVQNIKTGKYYNVSTSGLSKVKQGAVQAKGSTKSDRGVRISKNEKMFAYTVKKSGKTLTDAGWVQSSKLKAVKLGYYKAKKKTAMVTGSGYKFGNLKKNVTVQGFDKGKMKIRGQGTKWWIETNGSFINSGDMKLVGTYKMKL